MRHRYRARLRRPLPRRNHHPNGGDLIDLNTALDDLKFAANHPELDDPRHHRLVLAALEFKRTLDEYHRTHPDDDVTDGELDQLRADAIDAVLTVIASSWRLPAVDRYLTARTARDALER